MSINKYQINQLIKLSKFFKFFKLQITINSGNVLYVSNLSKRIRDEEIQERFTKYGKLTDLNIIRDPFTRECRGYGFITMENAKDGQSVIENMNKAEFDGRQINVEVSKRSRPHQSTPGVYLGTSTASNRRYRRYSPRRRYRSRSRSRSRSKSRDRYYRKHRYFFLILATIQGLDLVHIEENNILNLIYEY
jgi:RNA recognition motif-containing protein